MTDSRWYSALNAIMHFRADVESTDASKTARKAEELCVAAIALVALQEVEQRQFWIQPVSDKEQSPDVRTITFYDKGDGSAPDGVMQDVEVVSYEFVSGESVPGFLLRTKFAKGKAYDEQTTILLHIKEATKYPGAKEWEEVLGGSHHRSPVMLLGRAHPIEPVYTLIQVYPGYKKILEFNLPDLLKKQGYSGVLNLRRGSKKKNVRYDSEKHCPLEIMGIKCKGLN